MSTRDQVAWMDQAACASHPVDLWNPDRGGSTATAVRICNACPVQADCLAYAIDQGVEHGTWGGVGARARRDGDRGNETCPACPRLFPSPGSVANHIRQAHPEAITHSETLSRHGTKARYTAGCRCDDCKAANAACAREYRHRREAA